MAFQVSLIPFSHCCRHPFASSHFLLQLADFDTAALTDVLAAFGTTPNPPDIREVDRGILFACEAESVFLQSFPVQ